MSSGQFGDAGFREARLSPVEMCELLTKIEDTGFFHYETPNTVFHDGHEIYEFDETTQFSEGAPFISIQVNGQPSNQIDFYLPYVGYLIDEIKAEYQLLVNYRAPGMKAHVPEQLVLYIAKRSRFKSIEKIPETWPDKLVRFNDLWENSDSSEVFIAGDIVGPILTSLIIKRLRNFTPMARLSNTSSPVNYYPTRRPKVFWFFPFGRSFTNCHSIVIYRRLSCLI